MIFDETKWKEQTKEKAKNKKKSTLKQKNKIKRKKEKLPKVNAKAVSLLPFVDIDANFIEAKNGSVIDIYQIGSRDIHSLNEDEGKRLIYEMTKFYRVYQYDFKFVAMSFPANTKVQQQYLEKKISNTSNPIYIQYLNHKLEELKFLEKHRVNQEYYIFLFANSLSMLDDQKKTIRRMLQFALPIQVLPEEKKQQILAKLNNQNSKVIY